MPNLSIETTKQIHGDLSALAPEWEDRSPGLMMLVSSASRPPLVFRHREIYRLEIRRDRSWAIIPLYFTPGDPDAPRPFVEREGSEYVGEGWATRLVVDVVEACALALRAVQHSAPVLLDSATGFDRAPDRYTGKGRETVDRMRDRALAAAIALGLEAPYIPHEQTIKLADKLFAFACLTHAIKYEDRAGRKGSAEVDVEKAKWWRAMAAHAGGFGPDPRQDRETFEPYEYPAVEDLVALDTFESWLWTDRP